MTSVCPILTGAHWAATTTGGGMSACAAIAVVIMAGTMIMASIVACATRTPAHLATFGIATRNHVGATIAIAELATIGQHAWAAVSIAAA